MSGGGRPILNTFLSIPANNSTDRKKQQWHQRNETNFAGDCFSPGFGCWWDSNQKHGNGDNNKYRQRRAPSSSVFSSRATRELFQSLSVEVNWGPHFSLHSLSPVSSAFLSPLLFIYDFIRYLVIWLSTLSLSIFQFIIRRPLLPASLPDPIQSFCLPCGSC